MSKITNDGEPRHLLNSLKLHTWDGKLFITKSHFHFYIPSHCFGHFYRAVLKAQIVFEPPPQYVGFESLRSLHFLHLSKFRNQISPPNVFLGKF